MNDDQLATVIVASLGKDGFSYPHRSDSDDVIEISAYVESPDLDPKSLRPLSKSNPRYQFFELDPRYHTPERDIGIKYIIIRKTPQTEHSVVGPDPDLLKWDFIKDRIETIESILLNLGYERYAKLPPRIMYRIPNQIEERMHNPTGIFMG